LEENTGCGAVMFWPVRFSSGMHSCSSPYEFSWLTGTIANGTYTIAKVVECLYLNTLYFVLTQNPCNGFCFLKFSIITSLCVFVPRVDFCCFGMYIL
jgi:hypothetical protein